MEEKISRRIQEELERRMSYDKPGPRRQIQSFVDDDNDEYVTEPNRFANRAVSRLGRGKRPLNNDDYDQEEEDEPTDYDEGYDEEEESETETPARRTTGYYNTVEYRIPRLTSQIFGRR